MTLDERLAEGGEESLRFCPHCTLHCDDAIDPVGRLIVDCSLAKTRQTMADNATPRWGDAKVKADDVLRNAREHFDSLERSPSRDSLVVTFGSVGMATVQSLLQSPLSQRLSFVGDRERSIDVLMKSLIRESLVSATLGDVRQHADHVWLVGEFETCFPRVERWIAPAATCERLNVLSEDDLVRIANPHDSDHGRYLSIIVGPGGLGDDANDSAILAEMLLSRVRRHNASGRSRVTLSWLDPILSAASVHGWMTNRRLLTNRGEAKIRVGSPVPGSQFVDLQIGGLDGGPDLCTGFVPAPYAGLDRSDVVTRGDGTMTVPLTAIAASDNPPTILKSIHELFIHA